MGFVYTPAVYRLSFEDPDMAGFECAMRELSVDELLDVTEVLYTDPGQSDSRKRVIRRAELISGAIIEWNLTHTDGSLRPITAGTLMSMGHRFNTALTAAWLREVVGLTIPPAQISGSSPDGSSSAGDLLATLPMEPGDGD